MPVSGASAILVAAADVGRSMAGEKTPAARSSLVGTATKKHRSQMNPAFTDAAVARPVLRKETALAALDMAAAFACLWLALWARFGRDIPAAHLIPYLTYCPVLIAWRVFMAQCFGLYDFRCRLTTADHAFGGLGAALAGVVPGYAALAVIQLYYAPATRLSRAVAGLDLAFLAAWFVMSRAVALCWLRHVGYAVRVLVAGPADSAQALADEMRRHAPKLLDVTGAVEARDLAAQLDRERVDRVVLSGEEIPQRALSDLLYACDRHSADVLVHPGLGLAALASARVVSMAGVPLVALTPAAAGSAYRAVKRAIDATVALGMLIGGLPFWVVVGLGIRAGSRGPLFLSQERLGVGGRPFQMFKFRTMIADAEADTGPALASKDDPRVTPLGRVLRRRRIDEIPQLWNVLRGEMSLVGPRPERPEFARGFIEENPLYERRFLAKPGLTGLAQVHGRYDTNYTQKLRYDLIYINGASLALDLRILAATLRTVLTGRGAA